MLDFAAVPQGLLLPGLAESFDLPRTLDCGQAFRWRRREDGGWEGAAGGRYLRLERRGADILLQAGAADLPFWRSYFEIGRAHV